MKQLVMVLLLLKGKPSISPQKLHTCLEKSILNGKNFKYLVCYGLFSSIFGWAVESFLLVKKEK